MLLNTVLERNEEIAYMLSGKIKYFMQIIPQLGTNVSGYNAQHILRILRVKPLFNI